MGLDAKQVAYIASGAVIIGGVYLAKKTIMTHIDAAAASNQAALNAHQANAQALVAAGSISGMGDATTPTPPEGILATQANLQALSTIVATVTGAITAVVTLYLGYLAIVEKHRVLYAKKGEA
jgi:hypothetical protein